MQLVPDEFKLAKRANLFFMLNPDNFITNVMGPDVMTYTKVEIDPKITEFIPFLQEIYQRWLKPIQVAACNIYYHGRYGRICGTTNIEG